MRRLTLLTVSIYRLTVKFSNAETLNTTLQAVTRGDLKRDYSGIIALTAINRFEAFALQHGGFGWSCDSKIK